MSTLLTTIKNAFEQLNLDFVDYKLQENYPFDRLKLVFGQDYKERPIIIHLTAFEQSQLKQLKQMIASEASFDRLQIIYEFPFSLEEKQGDNIANLILFINTLLDIPGFEVDLFHKRIRFRTVQVYGKQELDVQSLLGIIGTIFLYLETYMSTIENVNSSKTTFLEVLQQVLEISEKMSEKFSKE